jgi:hypothetical protein
MLRGCDIAYCSEPLVFYRAHRTTVSKTTKTTVRGLEDAYSVAAAYLWMREDDRYLPELRETVLRRVKARLFDLFADPEMTIPDHLRFAADLLYRAVPDKRLLSK